MKLFRICYFAVLLSLLLIGLLSGRREVFLLFFIVLFVLVCALALNLWTFFSFAFSQKLTATAVKGDRPVMKVRISNEKLFPFTLMKITIQTTLPDNTTIKEISLAPKSDAVFDIELNCAYRGPYRVGITKMLITDVFGLLSMRFNMRILPYYRLKELIVYPKVIHLPYLPSQDLDDKYKNSLTHSFSDYGEVFSAIRQYQPGDPLKKIHWPSAARYRELYVKNYDTPNETSVIIFIDNAYDVYKGEDMLRYADLACECAASLANCALHSGYTVKFTDATGHIIQVNSIHEFSRLHHHLAVLPFPEKGNLQSSFQGVLLGETQIKTIYYISSNEAASFESLFKKYAQTGCQVKRLALGYESRKTVSAKTTAVKEIPVEFGADISTVLGGAI